MSCPFFFSGQLAVLSLYPSLSFPEFSYLPYISRTVVSSTSDGSITLETLSHAPSQLSVRETENICLRSTVLHCWVPSYLVFYNLVIHQTLFIPFTVVGFNQEKNFTELSEECRRVSVAEKVYHRQETNSGGNSVFLSYFTEVEWEHQTIAFCSHKKSLVYLKYSESLPRL